MNPAQSLPPSRNSGRLGVSISCTTYNQEGYIAQALESFLAQQTNFPIEILVHDDASTDGTAAVVREYERNHPHVVRPLYQTENQYSKGVKITPLNTTRARYKYVALCEGDDYWTDPSKLQRQVDLLEGRPCHSLCIHRAVRVKDSGTFIDYVRPFKGDRITDTSEVISHVLNAFATNSMVFPTRLLATLPPYYFSSPVGDWPLILYLSTVGPISYIDEPMSAYRVFAKNSWTARLSQDVQKQIAHWVKMISFLGDFDKSTGRQYSRQLARHRRLFESKLHRLVTQSSAQFDREQRRALQEFYNSLGARSRLTLAMRTHAPRAFDVLARAKLLAGASSSAACR